MKLLFPGGGATEAKIKELLSLSMEGRKRVKDQLMRIDSTYPEVEFSFTDKTGQVTRVQTLEEREHPRWYHRRNVEDADEAVIDTGTDGVPAAPRTPDPVSAPAAPAGPKPGHVTFAENQKGVSFDVVFGPWLDGAIEVTLTDPYIRVYHQMRNLMELLEVIALRKPDGEDVRFALLCRPKCSFKPPFVRKRRGFSNLMLSVGGADCKSRLCIRRLLSQPCVVSPKDAARSALP